MKAIHNCFMPKPTLINIVSNMSKILNESNSQRNVNKECEPIIVSNMSKILNESNSQLLFQHDALHRNCFQYVKDTK